MALASSGSLDPPCPQGAGLQGGLSPHPEQPLPSSHQVQAAAIHQGGEVLQVYLRAVQHLLDAEQRVLGGTRHARSAPRL